MKFWSRASSLPETKAQEDTNRCQGSRCRDFSSTRTGAELREVCMCNWAQIQRIFMKSWYLWLTGLLKLLRMNGCKLEKRELLKATNNPRKPTSSLHFSMLTSSPPALLFISSAFRDFSCKENFLHATRSEVLRPSKDEVPHRGKHRYHPRNQRS